MLKVLKKEVNFNTILIVFIVASVSLMSIYYANLLSYKHVTVMDNGIKSVYSTKAKTVNEFLCENNIAIRTVDKLDTERSVMIKNNMNINITRAFPIRLVYNKELRKVFATEMPVAKMLESNSITISDKDYISVDINEKVEPNMDIEIKGYSEETVQEKIIVPFSEKIIDTDELTKGKREVVKEGVNGEKIVKYKVTYLGGVEQNRTKIDETVTKEPQERIIKRGTADVYRAPNGKEYKYSKVLSMTATAYNEAEIKGSTGHTALGWQVREGIVAVDPKVIPLRTRLYIQGYGEAVAGDTGGAIKGNKIDLYMDSLQEVYAYGVKRNVKVYVLK